MLLLLTTASMWAQNRSVAVVYDNSSSMTEYGQCEGINYAMQVLVGLLHQQDELSVFKMQPPNGTPINLFSKNDAIRQISNTYNCLERTTPFTAIANAAQQLRKSSKPLKWLIILSDGEITEQGFELSYPNDLQQLVTQAGARIIFLNVNAKTNVLDTFLDAKAPTTKTLRTKGNFTDVVNTMEQIASGVMTFSNGITVQQQGSTAKFTSPVPLRRVVVLQQQTSQTSGKLPAITGATAGGKSLSIDKSYNAQKSKGTYGMSGNVTHLEPSGIGVIPLGEVSINFNAAPNFQRTKFFPEAAVKLSTELIGGTQQQQSSVYKICDTAQHVLLTATLTDDSNRALSAEVLKKCKVQCINETNAQKTTLQLDPATGKFTAKIPMTGNKITLSVSAEFTGYFNLLSNIYTIEKEKCVIPKAVFDAKGGLTTLTAKVTQLAYAPSVTVTPKIQQDNGMLRNPTPAELKQLEIIQLNDSRLKLRVDKNPDGTFTIKPTTRICACFTPTGSDNLQFELRSKSPSIKTDTNSKLTVAVTVQDDTFWAKCGALIIALLVILLLLWYIRGIIIKPRFCLGSEIIYTRVTNVIKNKPKSYPLPGSFFNRWLIPYKPEKIMVGSVMFIAGSRCSHILVSAKTQNEYMFLAGMPLDNPGKKDERLSNGEKVEVVTGSIKESYEYRKLDNRGEIV